MAKENKVSFRLDNDIMEILSRCEGESNNQRFENLVRESFQRLPEVKKQIAQEQQALETTLVKCSNARKELANLGLLRMYQQNMYAKYQEFIQSMQQLVEGVDKL